MAINPVRRKICKIALGESDAVPPEGCGGWGRVTDWPPNGPPDRHGWQNLKTYFNEAMKTPPNWGDTTKRLYVQNPDDPKTRREVQITYQEGIQKRGYRVPQDSAGRGIQWCGIFAAWVLKRAELDAYWVSGVGIRGG
jgi:hypothetical protein